MDGPFRKGAGREWTWPSRFAVDFDAETAVVTADTEVGYDAPDLRALSLLEASVTGQLIDGRQIARVRVNLPASWAGSGGLDRICDRVGLFAGVARQPIALQFDGSLRSTSDPFGGQLPLLASGEDEIPATGKGLRLLAKGIDAWITSVREALNNRGYDAADPPTRPRLRLLPVGDVHPRIEWIQKQLANAGVDVAVPPRREPAALTSFKARMLEGSIVHKRALGITESGTYKGEEYEHILPPAKAAFAVWEKLRSRIDQLLPVQHRHQMFANLKSSQAFALNLLGGLLVVDALPTALERVLGLSAGRIRSDPPVRLVFEYSSKATMSLLGETEHATQVDAAIWFTDGETKERRAFLVEVKLTEDGFGACRGPHEKTNLDRAACLDPVDRLTRCYLRRPPLKRTYLDHLATAYPQLAERLSEGGACPLRADGYQLARNLTIAAWLDGRVAPDKPPTPEDRVALASFHVLSARATPALSSPPLVPLGDDSRQRLAALGVGWIDARALVENVRELPGATELLDYLRGRYSPVFLD